METLRRMLALYYVAIAGASVGACSGHQLNRADAQRQLAAKYTGETRYLEMGPFRIRAGSSFNQPGLGVYAALIDAGLIKATLIGSGDSTYDIPTSTWISLEAYQLTFTEKAEPYTSGPSLVLVATAKSIDITGVTEARTGSGPVTSFVDFRINWERTPFGEILGNAGLMPRTPAQFTSTAREQFIKYDDGWRLAKD